jgi:hypothetical protein
MIGGPGHARRDTGEHGAHEDPTTAGGGEHPLPLRRGTRVRGSRAARPRRGARRLRRGRFPRAPATEHCADPSAEHAVTRYDRWGGSMITSSGMPSYRGRGLRRVTRRLAARVRAPEELRRRTRRRGSAWGGGTGRSLSAPAVPILVPVRGRLAIVRGGRLACTAMWRPYVLATEAQSSSARFSSTSGCRPTCRHPATTLRPVRLELSHQVPVRR